jgi:hypothetical protein
MLFVLTEKEGSCSKPVGVCSKQGDANAWAARSKGNDWYSFEVDQLDHLNFAYNGPDYRPDPRPVEGVIMPVQEMPKADGTLEGFKNVSKYLHGVLDTMESMRDMLQASLQS